MIRFFGFRYDSTTSLFAVGDLFFASALTNRTYEARYCTDTLGNVDNLIICPLASYRFQIARSFRLVKDSLIEIEGVHLVYRYQLLSLSSIIFNANAFSEIFSIEILGFLQPEKKTWKIKLFSKPEVPNTCERVKVRTFIPPEGR